MYVGNISADVECIGNVFSQTVVTDLVSGSARKRELQMQQQAKERELQKQQQFELEKLRLQHQLDNNHRDNTSKSNQEFDVAKHIRLVPPFQEKDIDQYFHILRKLLKI